MQSNKFSSFNDYRFQGALKSQRYSIFGCTFEFWQKFNKYSKLKCVQFLENSLVYIVIIMVVTFFMQMDETEELIKIADEAAFQLRVAFDYTD